MLILAFDADFLVINKVEPVELILGKHVNKSEHSYNIMRHRNFNYIAYYF